MKVKTDELRTAFERTLRLVESLRGDSVEIDPDLYWFIPRPQVYDPTADPVGFTLGSVEDDWSQISAIGRGEKEPVEYALVWMAAVLRVLGEHGTS
jgi:hypothetical protein